MTLGMLTAGVDELEPVRLDDIARMMAARETSLGEYFGAVVGDAVMQGSRALFGPDETAALRSADGQINPQASPEGPPTAIEARTRSPVADTAFLNAQERGMTQDAYRASPSFREALPFDPWLTEDGARERAAEFDERQWRSFLRERRSNGVTTAAAWLVGSFGGALADPINFFPALGPTMRTAMAAKAASRFGYVLTRGATDAAEGAALNAAIEPFIMADARRYGDDMTLTEALVDIAFGAAVGGITGGGGAWWHSRPGRGWQPPTAAGEPSAAGLDLAVRPERIAREVETIGLAASDLTQGRPVDVGPPVAPEARAAVERLREAVGRDDPAQGVSLSPRDPAADEVSAREAIERAIAAQGSVPRALSRDDIGIGSITVDWGYAGDPARGFAGGYGLSHILAKRGAEGFDAQRWVREFLPKVLAQGAIVDRRNAGTSAEKVTLGHGPDLAMLSLYRSGERETFVLTGLRSKPRRGPGGPGSLTPRPYAPEPSGSRAAEGAGDPGAPGSKGSGGAGEVSSGPSYAARPLDFGDAQGAEPPVPDMTSAPTGASAAEGGDALPDVVIDHDGPLPFQRAWDDTVASSEPDPVAEMKAAVAQPDRELADDLESLEAIVAGLERRGVLSDASRAEIERARAEEARLAKIGDAYDQAAACVIGGLA